MFSTQLWGSGDRGRGLSLRDLLRLDPREGLRSASAGVAFFLGSGDFIARDDLDVSALKSIR